MVHIWYQKGTLTVDFGDIFGLEGCYPHFRQFRQYFVAMRPLSNTLFSSHVYLRIHINTFFNQSDKTTWMSAFHRHLVSLADINNKLAICPSIELPLFRFPLVSNVLVMWDPKCRTQFWNWANFTTSSFTFCLAVLGEWHTPHAAHKYVVMYSNLTKRYDYTFQLTPE